MCSKHVKYDVHSWNFHTLLDAFCSSKISTSIEFYWVTVHVLHIDMKEDRLLKPVHWIQRSPWPCYCFQIFLWCLLSLSFSACKLFHFSFCVLIPAQSSKDDILAKCGKHFSYFGCFDGFDGDSITMNEIHHCSCLFCFGGPCLSKNGTTVSVDFRNNDVSSLAIVYRKRRTDTYHLTFLCAYTETE